MHFVSSTCAPTPGRIARIAPPCEGLCVVFVCLAGRLYYVIEANDRRPFVSAAGQSLFFASERLTTQSSTLPDSAPPAAFSPV